MSIDWKEAQALAVRTEPQDYTKAIERLSMCAGDLMATMDKVIAFSHQLDAVKKFIFYGKPYEDMRPLPISSPESIGRLAGCIRILHATIGLVTESGELVEQVRSHAFLGTDLDQVNLLEEGGDQSWYLRLLADALALTGAMSVVGTENNYQLMHAVNIDKLRKRFPDKFTEHDANHRDLGAERKTLEGEAPVTRI